MEQIERRTRTNGNKADRRKGIADRANRCYDPSIGKEADG